MYDVIFVILLIYFLYVLVFFIVIVVVFSVQDVQQKVKPYLLAVDMSSFQYDTVIRVLDMVNKYVNIKSHITHLYISLIPRLYSMI